MPAGRQPDESRLGVEALLSRESARMRASLASATLGVDHALLLARKRSTDWAFLAAALTAGIGAGESDASALLASVISCDPVAFGAANGVDATRLASAMAARRDAILRPRSAGPLVADVVTYFAEASGADFPCAIRWRVIHDDRGIVARPVWHEPMVGLRGFDAPLVPDRTTIRLSHDGTDVECWGSGRMQDPWPGAPAPLDQLADTYDFADAARHWIWAPPFTLTATRALLPSRADRGGELRMAMPECDVTRIAPWVVSSHRRRDSGEDAPEQVESTRASVAVALRQRPSELVVRQSRRAHEGTPELRAIWTEGQRIRAALTWAAHPRSRNLTRESLCAPSHGWLDAQARIALLQHVTAGATLPEPYTSEMILGASADESAAHARAAANVWRAAIAGDCSSLAGALADSERLRHSRGLPRSVDAMALVALAETLADRGAPESAVELVVSRHLLIASSLPPDPDAAVSESGPTDIAPSLSRAEYGAMLDAQGRRWAAAHCLDLDRPGSWNATAGVLAADPVVRDFAERQALRQRGSGTGAPPTGAPAEIHARTLAISAAESRSPSGGMASSSSTGSVSTVRSELASGSPGLTIVRPWRCWPIRDAGSSSLIPAFCFPPPWQSKQWLSKMGRMSAYEPTAPA